MKILKREKGRLLLFLLLLALDQISKRLVIVHLKGAPPRVLIPGVLELVYTENTGAAFGTLLNQRWLLLVMGLVLVCALCVGYAALPATSKWVKLKYLLAVLLAGALGNLVDRALYGFVVDFIYFVPINFPKFNLADSCIVVSLILAFILLIFVYKDEDLKEIRFGKRRKNNIAD